MARRTFRQYGDIHRWHGYRIGVGGSSKEPVADYLLFTQLQFFRETLYRDAWRSQQYIDWRCCSCTRQLAVRLSKATRKSMYCSDCRGLYTQIGSAKSYIEFKQHVLTLLNANIV